MALMWAEIAPASPAACAGAFPPQAAWEFSQNEESCKEVAGERGTWDFLVVVKRNKSFQCWWSPEFAGWTWMIGCFLKLSTPSPSFWFCLATAGAHFRGPACNYIVNLSQSLNACLHKWVREKCSKCLILMCGRLSLALCGKKHPTDWDFFTIN